MKSQEIKKHVKGYYQSQSMNEEKIELLMDIANQYSEKEAWDNSNLKNKESQASWFNTFVVQQKVALVASVMLLVVSFWGFSNFEQNKYLRSNFTQIVAQEIALNHRKQLSLDFKEIDYSILNKLMHKLDFQIMESKNVNLAGLEVVGARYCSIQGNIAAQIRLRDDEGKIFTLYQTKLTDMLEKTPANIQAIDQVDVKQWQENNLFFGLATSLDSAS